MPITADGYYWTYSQYVPPTRRTGVGTFTALVAASGRWTSSSSGSANLGASDASHAERAAYKDMKRAVGQSKTFYLFVQNAFPCEKCLEFFQGEPRENYFIFVISEDQGSYSLDNGLKDHEIRYPQIVYIQGGQRWYPGYVKFWTKPKGSDERIFVRALRSCNDPEILDKDGNVKKPQNWPDFPSIQSYL